MEEPLPHLVAAGTDTGSLRCSTSNNTVSDRAFFGRGKRNLEQRHLFCQAWAIEHICSLLADEAVPSSGRRPVPTCRIHGRCQPRLLRLRA